jgi:thiazolylpeptide-type bacteriocin precursor
MGEIPTLELEDLEIGDIAMTSMRDAVALPETGASWSVSCVESCSCCSIEEVFQ